MSAAAIIQPLVEAALRGDAALKAMFPANKVRVYDVPPTNAKTPYLVIGEDSFDDVSGEGVSLSEISATVHVWSLTDPPGKLEAKRIGDRVEQVLIGLAGGDLPIRTAWPIAARYLTDRDMSCHGVITVGLAREAA